MEPSCPMTDYKLIPTKQLQTDTRIELKGEIENDGLVVPGSV